MREREREFIVLPCTKKIKKERQVGLILTKFQVRIMAKFFLCVYFVRDKVDGEQKPNYLWVFYSLLFKINIELTNYFFSLNY